MDKQTIPQIISETNDFFIEEGNYKAYLLLNSTILLTVDLENGMTVGAVDVSDIINDTFENIDEVIDKSKKSSTVISM